MDNQDRCASKRLVIIQGGFPSISATFILDQMTGLIDRGMEIENWSTHTTGTTANHREIEIYSLLKKTKYIREPLGDNKRDPKIWLESFEKENNITRFPNIEAFHVHYGVIFNRFEPLFRMSDAFVLVSFHGYDASRYFKEMGDHCYSYLFERADQITTPSQHMKNELARRGCNPAKIVIHRYGINMQNFSSPQRTYDKEKLTLLTVGRFVEKKGIEYSLRAFAKIHRQINAEYRIIGEGPLREKYLEIASQEGIGDRVTILGPKPKDAIIREMQNADVFILTSVVAADGDSEGVPVALTEAHAMGLPVISSYHTGIPELVAHGKTGLLSVEKDVDAIAGNILKLASQMQLREKFSKAAVERVKDEFDIIRLNDKLFGILRDGSRRSSSF